MKSMRWIIVLAVLAVLGFAAWRLLPGCRQRARDVVAKYGGWTDAARREDPVGFIDYAENKLQAHVAQLRDARKQLAGARETIADKRNETAQLAAKAQSLGAEFRAAFQAAERVDGYPVAVAGGKYTRAELIEQVRLILMQKRNYADILSELKAVDAAAAQKEQQLAVQINNTQAALSTLPSKREIARVDRLTGRSERLLQQVDELMGRNEELLEESPVRTVEELSAVPAVEPRDGPVGLDEVEAFLRDGEAE